MSTVQDSQADALATKTDNPSSIEEDAVYQRYADAAQELEPALCCPVSYSKELLEAIPEEVLERDYGCGDPTPFVREGDTVLDLGSGGGKLCFISAQMVGPRGRVIGVDCNESMRALANEAAPKVAEKIGYSNVDFRYGLIQDLQLNLGLLQEELSSAPVGSTNDYLRLRNTEARLRREKPLIESDSVDCVLSNCVLNLVRVQDRKQMFEEIFRVLKRGGRAAISDIVCDEDVPQHLQDNPELWSGCISGAYREDKFLEAFEDAGFHGIEIVKREPEPWQTVEGIEFRSMTVVAYKGKQGPCMDRNQALIYRGPFKVVKDDDGHLYYRGERMAVCEKTFELLQRAPYQGMFEPVEPLEIVTAEDAKVFDCRRNIRRSPAESKGQDYAETKLPDGDCCSTDEPCC